MDKIKKNRQNWRTLKIGQNEKSDKIGQNWTTLKIGQNEKSDKMKNWDWKVKV